MASWEKDVIDEDSFFGFWGATISKTGDLFSFEEVKDRPVNFIWTITQSGGEAPDHWIAAPGFHVVNVLGYVLTQRPWNSTTPDAYYFFDDFDTSEEAA